MIFIEVSQKMCLWSTDASGGNKALIPYKAKQIFFVLYANFTSLWGNVMQAMCENSLDESRWI